MASNNHPIQQHEWEDTLITRLLYCFWPPRRNTIWLTTTASNQVDGQGDARAIARARNTIGEHVTEMAADNFNGGSAALARMEDGSAQARARHIRVSDAMGVVLTRHRQICHATRLRL